MTLSTLLQDVSGRLKCDLIANSQVPSRMLNQLPMRPQQSQCTVLRGGHADSHNDSVRTPAWLSLQSPLLSQTATLRCSTEQETAAGRFRTSPDPGCPVASSCRAGSSQPPWDALCILGHQVIWKSLDLGWLISTGL